MENFTPIGSLAGGILIGLSASLLLLLNGKIAGITGIVGGLLAPVRKDVAWRIAFVAGLFAGALLLRAYDSNLIHMGLDRSPTAIVIAGLLVGFGARLGNGCTSGHGVCGISRGSKRSIVATTIFMATGALTVLLVRQLFGGAL